MIYTWDMLMGRETCRIITLHENYVDKRVILFHMNEDKMKNRHHLYIVLPAISLDNKINKLVLETALIAVYIARVVNHDHEAEKRHALSTEILYLSFTVFHWQNFLLMIQYHQYMIGICFKLFFYFLMAISCTFSLI